MFKWWEKYDQWVGFILGAMVAIVGLKLTIAFVLWAETAVKETTVLRWLFGWLF